MLPRRWDGASRHHWSNAWCPPNKFFWLFLSPAHLHSHSGGVWAGLHWTPRWNGVVRETPVLAFYFSLTSFNCGTGLVAYYNSYSVIRIVEYAFNVVFLNFVSKFQKLNNSNYSPEAPLLLMHSRSMSHHNLWEAILQRGNSAEVGRAKEHTSTYTVTYVRKICKV